MRTSLISAAIIASFVTLPIRGYAADEPALHRLDGFMVKGVFTELDRERIKHRFSQQEIERDGLDGRPRAIGDILGQMAALEKLQSRIDEPLQVRGDIHITVTPNTTGDELYSTFFVAFSYNGLVLSGEDGELVLVRPETRPALAPLKWRWNRDRILSTRLFRLGYLNSDEILRRYREGIGTPAGHAVLELKSNVLIVADTDSSLEKLGQHIDSESLEAMGTPAAEAQAPAEAPRPPSLGAIASREGIHFYLLAYARFHQIPLFASQQAGATRSYPEADLWLSERGFQELEQEYRRLADAAHFTREAIAQGWVDPHPKRTLTPATQKRLEIRFGLVNPLPGKAATGATKKSARRKR